MCNIILSVSAAINSVIKAEVKSSPTYLDSACTGKRSSDSHYKAVRLLLFRIFRRPATILFFVGWLVHGTLATFCFAKNTANSLTTLFSRFIIRKCAQTELSLYHSRTLTTPEDANRQHADDNVLHAQNPLDLSNIPHSYCNILVYQSV